MVAASERQRLSTPDVVRGMLKSIGEECLANILPAAKVTAGHRDAGTSEDLPTLTIEWGDAEAYDQRSEDEEVLADGRGVWRLQREETPAAFKLYARTPEDADWAARELVRRLKKKARLSNAEGNPVLHFVVDAGGARRTGKVYVAGHVRQLRSDDEVLRSLYAFRVPVTVDYPVMEVDEAKEIGRLNIIVEVNGRAIALNDMEEES